MARSVPRDPASRRDRYRVVVAFHLGMDCQTSTVLVSLVLNAGLSHEELARASGVPLSSLVVPTLVPYREGIRLWQAAEELSGDPCVGLHAGASFGVDQLSVLGTTFAHAPTLGTGLEALTRLLPLVIRGATFELGTEGALRYESPGTDRHGVDCMFAAITSASRLCTGRPLEPVAVRFQAPRPMSTASYESFFGVLPEWQQPVCELRFADADQRAPMRGAEAGTAALLEKRAHALLRDEGASSTSALERSVEAALRSSLSQGRPTTVGAVAAVLGTSARTLQRKLSAAGLSHSVIRERVLTAVADELLADESRRVDEVASRLGFTSRSAFARAYRRWTGTAPRKRAAGTEPP